MGDMSLKIRRLSQEPGEPMSGEGHSGVNTVRVIPMRSMSAYS